MPTPVLQDADLDALAEVCRLGMERAATALSQLTGKGVDVELPRLLVLDAGGVAESPDAQEAICLHLQILGNVRGAVVVLLREAEARCLLELLLGRRPAPGLPLSELEASALREVGNILASAFLNALGAALDMTLLPSAPSLFSGEAGEVLAQVVEQPAEERPIVMIEAAFSIAASLCGGRIFLMPAPASLGLMLAALVAR